MYVLMLHIEVLSCVANSDDLVDCNAACPSNRKKFEKILKITHSKVG